MYRAAWDFAGTGLAGRNELYERFYLGSAGRMLQVAHFGEQLTRKGAYPLLEAILRDEE